MSTRIGLVKVLRDSGCTSYHLGILHVHVRLRLWALWDQVNLITSFVVSPSPRKNTVHSRHLMNVAFSGGKVFTCFT